MSSNNRLFEERDIIPSLGDFFRKIGGFMESWGFSCSVSENSGNQSVLELAEKEDQGRFRKISGPHGRYYFKESGAEKRYYPYSDCPGVYVFFDKDKRGVYVGKSENSVGKRIWDHVRYYRARKSAEYVVSIPFSEADFLLGKKAAYLAPAFESYLLDNYKFPGNSVGQRKRA